VFRIAANLQHFFATTGEGHGDVATGGGFANATFAIDSEFHGGSPLGKSGWNRTGAGMQRGFSLDQAQSISIKLGQSQSSSVRQGRSRLVFANLGELPEA
jgi:hypothetical protein